MPYRCGARSSNQARGTGSRCSAPEELSTILTPPVAQPVAISTRGPARPRFRRNTRPAPPHPLSPASAFVTGIARGGPMAPRGTSSPVGAGGRATGGGAASVVVARGGGNCVGVAGSHRVDQAALDRCGSRRRTPPGPSAGAPSINSGGFTASTPGSGVQRPERQRRNPHLGQQRHDREQQHHRRRPEQRRHPGRSRRDRDADQLHIDPRNQHRPVRRAAHSVSRTTARR